METEGLVSSNLPRIVLPVLVETDLIDEYSDTHDYQYQTHEQKLQHRDGIVGPRLEFRFAFVRIPFEQQFDLTQPGEFFPGDGFYVFLVDETVSGDGVVVLVEHRVAHGVP